MTKVPLVAVGCPIRNREWILPRYLGALGRLQYPVDRLRFGFIVNDCQDRTEELLRAWDRKPHIEVVDLGFPAWTRSQGYSLANLARLRNHLLEWFISSEAAYLFSVDSDILVPPDSLQRLVAHDRPVISLIVCNTPERRLRSQRPLRAGRLAYNIMRLDEDGQPVHLYDQYPRGGLFEVAITGAACLIRRDVLEAGTRYAYHPLGEDVFFCQEARRRGFSIWCDSRIQGRHEMVEQGP